MHSSGVTLVTLTAVAVGVTYTNHAPLIPLLQADFSLSEVQAGLLTTALFLTSVVTFLGGGSLADRTGPWRINALGVALALAGNVLFALAPSYPWLLAAKAVTGLGSGLAFTSGMSYVAAQYGERRSHLAVGLYGAGYPLGGAIGVLTMAPLAVLTDWRGAFWISSAAIAVALALWAMTPHVAATRPAGSVLQALSCPNCWWTSVQHAGGFGLVVAAGTWVTVYLLREFALPLDLSGVLGSLLLLIAVFARTFGGWLLVHEHLATRAVMRIGQVVILAGLALLALPARPLPLALAGALAVGLGGGIPYAAVFNTAAASLPKAPGSAQGLAAIGGTVGILIFAPAMGYAVQTWGFWAAWLVLGTVAGTALFGTFVMRGEEEAG